MPGNFCKLLFCLFTTCICAISHANNIPVLHMTTTCRSISNQSHGAIVLVITFLLRLALPQSFSHCQVMTNGGCLYIVSAIVIVIIFYIVLAVNCASFESSLARHGHCGNVSTGDMLWFLANCSSSTWGVVG